MTAAVGRVMGIVRVAVVALTGVLSACVENERPPPMGDMTLGGQHVPSAVLESGRTLYARYCASCHGIDGSGRGSAVGQLPARPRDFRSAQFLHSDAAEGALPSHDDLVTVIRNGVTEKGMPAWSGLRPDDLDALAHYIKTFSPRWRERAD